jgi:hypothetical protein
LTSPDALRVKYLRPYRYVFDPLMCLFPLSFLLPRFLFALMPFFIFIFLSRLHRRTSHYIGINYIPVPLPSSSEPVLEISGSVSENFLMETDPDPTYRRIFGFIKLSFWNSF